MKKLLIAALVGVAAVTAGCKEESKTAGPVPSTQSGTAAEVPKAAGHNRIALGETTVGSLKLVATMDEPVKAAGGGEGAFDLVITGGKPKAVRFWVGNESGDGSVKAKAEEETTDNWHTHAEVPDPLPPGSKFWVEVEPQTGEMFKASFSLKVQ